MKNLDLEKNETKKEKIAKVNFTNSAVIDLLIDKSIFKLEAMKNFVAGVGENVNTENVMKFIEIANNLIFNSCINENITLWENAKKVFSENVAKKSINFFKNILHKAYMTAFDYSLRIDKETHTETTCTKKFVDRQSTAKYFKYVMLAILTENGKNKIAYNSISNSFELVIDEVCEGLEG